MGGYVPFLFLFLFLLLQEGVHPVVEDEGERDVVLLKEEEEALRFVIEAVGSGLVGGWVG